MQKDCLVSNGVHINLTKWFVIHAHLPNRSTISGSSFFFRPSQSRRMSPSWVWGWRNMFGPIKFTSTMNLVTSDVSTASRGDLSCLRTSGLAPMLARNPQRSLNLSIPKRRTCFSRWGKCDKPQQVSSQSDSRTQKKFQTRYWKNRFQKSTLSGKLSWKLKIQNHHFISDILTTIDKWWVYHLQVSLPECSLLSKNQSWKHHWIG